MSLIEQLAVCDPTIEECERWEITYDNGSFWNTAILGFVSLVLGTLPLFMKFTFSDVEEKKYSSSDSNQGFAINIWWASHFSIWFLLAVVWPLSYLEVEILNFIYIVYWQLIGLWVGFITLFMCAGLFIFAGANETDTAYKYAFAILGVEIPALILVYFMYDDAFAFYVPQPIYRQVNDPSDQTQDIDEEREAEEENME